MCLENSESNVSSLPGKECVLEKANGLGETGRAKESIAGSALNLEDLTARSGHRVALKLIKSGKVSPARELLDKLMVEFPDNIFIMTTAGVFEAKNGNSNKARQVFERGAALHPTNAPIRQAWALMEASRGPRCASKARQLFREATEADPSHGPCWQAWAMFEDQQSRKASHSHSLSHRGLQNVTELETSHTTARELFRKGSKLAPSHAPLWQAWARMEESEGNVDKARELYRTSTEKDPLHAHTWMAWAIMEQKAGDFETARSLLRSGSQIKGPKSGAIFQEWASLESECGNPSLARELYQKAVKANRKMPQTWLKWALFEKSQGDSAACRSLLQEGLKHLPSNAHLLHALACLERDNGNPEQSRALLLSALRVDPLNSHASCTLAELEVSNIIPPAPVTASKQAPVTERGRSETESGSDSVWGWMEGGLLSQSESGRLSVSALVSAYKQSNPLRSVNAQTVSTLCMGMAKRMASGGHEKQARDWLREAHTALPGCGRMLRSWALFECKMGRARQASELFRRSAQTEPRLTRSWLLWALWELRLGNVAKARAVLDRGLGLNPALLGKSRAGSEQLAQAPNLANSPAHLYLAWSKLEVRIGNVKFAREILEAGCLACPWYAPMWMDLARVLAGDLGEIRVLRKSGVGAEVKNNSSLRGKDDSDMLRSAMEVLNEGSRKALASRELVEERARVEELLGSSDNVAELKRLGREVRTHPANRVPRCIERTFSAGTRLQWRAWEGWESEANEDAELKAGGEEGLAGGESMSFVEMEVGSSGERL